MAKSIKKVSKGLSVIPDVSGIRALAIDLGTKCGWALSDRGVTSSGVWRLTTDAQRRYEGPGMRYVRFVKFLDELPEVDIVFYEEVRRHLGVDAAHIYGALQGRLQEWVDTRPWKVTITAFPVATIKKHATGKGNAGKEAMIEAFKSRVGRDPETDDEADAWFILDLGLESIGAKK